jgi:hypothetical protein
MRPNEINGLFKLSGLGNVCVRLCDKKDILEIFKEVQPEKASGYLIASLEDFFERRNQVAHSITMTLSSGPDQILKDVDLLRAFGYALCETLESVVTS